MESKRNKQKYLSEELMGIFVHIYNSGYKAGHHDTVEGGYVDIHSVDMETYHEENVAEIIDELVFKSHKEST